MVESRRTAKAEGGPRFWVRTRSAPHISGTFDQLCHAHVAGIHTEYPSTRRFSVVLISNQCLKSSELADWKKKIPLIAAAVRRLSRGTFAAVRSLCECFVLDMSRAFRCPNFRFGSLRPRREMGIGSPCLACGPNSSGFSPKTESR